MDGDWMDWLKGAFGSGDMVDKVRSVVNVAPSAVYALGNNPDEWSLPGMTEALPRVAEKAYGGGDWWDTLAAYADKAEKLSPLAKLAATGLGGAVSWWDAAKRRDMENAYANEMRGYLQQRSADVAAQNARTQALGQPMRYTNPRLAKRRGAWGAADQKAFSGNALAAMTPRTGDTMYAPLAAATGGSIGYLNGGTAGQADKIPALLSDGEFVMDADTVSALGDGNNAAGASALEQMRQNIRKHKRSAPVNKIPPKAKKPEQYLKKGKK